ncbi:MAG: pilin [Minisyncoccia bacterium]
MKNLIYTLALAVLLVGAAQSANADIQSGNPSGTFSLQNPLQFTTVGDLINGFLQIFSYVAVLFAVLMLVWVGLQFVLARGNPERMKVLKNWLLWIVIGAAIVIGARIIVSVVINTLGSTGAVNQNILNSANNALNKP